MSISKRFPLPNEPINKPKNFRIHPKKNRNQDKNLFSVDVKNIFKNIGLEEIILIGLVYILFDEGIADELLLIALIYIFFTEK